jgi:hypothetical protein
MYPCWGIKQFLSPRLCLLAQDASCCFLTPTHLIRRLHQQAVHWAPSYPLVFFQVYSEAAKASNGGSRGSSFKLRHRQRMQAATERADGPHDELGRRHFCISRLRQYAELARGIELHLICFAIRNLACLCDCAAPHSRSLSDARIVSLFITLHAAKPYRQATIRGTQGTPYEGLTYSLTLAFPANYPCSPPVIKFLTPCFHPNVDVHGNICLDILQVLVLELL